MGILGGGLSIGVLKGDFCVNGNRIEYYCWETIWKENIRKMISKRKRLGELVLEIKMGERLWVTGGNVTGVLQRRALILKSVSKRTT